MTIAHDLKDEWNGLNNARLPWERYWREIAMYVLPQTQHFDRMLGGDLSSAVSSVVGHPAASRRSADLYDMTSLWAIERLTAGMISLKTPESQMWHDMGTDSLFGEEHDHEEKMALERLRDYLFKIRSSPRSGFWPAHRAAVRSMCGFGDGWMYIEEVPGQSARLPYIYQHIPISELYPGVDKNGQPNRMFRVFRRSMTQAVEMFGYDKVPETVRRAANEPTQKHNGVTIMHAVRPRSDNRKLGQVGVRAGAFESHYLFPEDDHHVGEGGFYEFPFTRYAWANQGNSPFSEGPVAYAIGELKSLQEMAKNELIAVQTAIRPAFASAGKNYTKLNLNPGAINPNLVSPDGRPLIQPLNTGVRPDFAQAVIEARRNSIRELLYLNLWQIIIQDKDSTATEALIRAQEKGELLGPVGISLNEGLAHSTDREIGILGRKRAFDDDSPLAMPDSLKDADVSPRFTSPLDRLRRVGEVVGMQRLVEFGAMLGGGDPQKTAEIMARFDTDEMLERAQEILGAPVASLVSREAQQAGQEQDNQMQQTMAALAAIKGGGDAAASAGQGMQQLAQGAEMAGQSQGLQDAMTNMDGMVQAGAQGAANAGRGIV